MLSEYAARSMHFEASVGSCMQHQQQQQQGMQPGEYTIYPSSMVAEAEPWMDKYHNKIARLNKKDLNFEN